jgi:hypothetical protein
MKAMGRREGQRTARPYTMMISGAVGTGLAALLYFLATRLGGALRAFVPTPEAQVVIFVILLVIALAEMPITVFALRTLRASTVSRLMLHTLNGGYVAFAAVYAAVLVLLFSVSAFSALLVSLTAVRWVSDWWIR